MKSFFKKKEIFKKYFLVFDSYEKITNSHLCRIPDNSHKSEYIDQILADQCQIPALAGFQPVLSESNSGCQGWNLAIGTFDGRFGLPTNSNAQR
jgi:hypothetical protein